MQAVAPAVGAKYPGAHNWQVLCRAVDVKAPGGQGRGAGEAGGQKDPAGQGRGCMEPRGQKYFGGQSPVQLEEVSPCSWPKRPGGQGLRWWALLQ